jgi:hypothetical protein
MKTKPTCKSGRCGTRKPRQTQPAIHIPKKGPHRRDIPEEPKPKRDDRDFLFILCLILLVCFTGYTLVAGATMKRQAAEIQLLLEIIDSSTKQVEESTDRMKQQMDEINKMERGTL